MKTSYFKTLSLGLMGCLFLTGCPTDSKEITPPSPPVAQNEAEKIVPKGFDTLFNEEPKLVEQNLNSTLLFELMTSEIALRKGYQDLGYKIYFDMARREKNPLFAKKAYDIARRAFSPREMILTADLWLKLAPESKLAQLANSFNQLMKGEFTNETQKTLSELIQAIKEVEKIDEVYASACSFAMLANKNAKITYDFLNQIFKNITPGKFSSLPLGRLAFTAGLKEEASSLANIAYKLNPDSPDAILLCADTHLADDKEGAVSILESFLDKHPQANSVRLGLAKVYTMVKKADKADEVLQPLLPLTQSNPSIAFSVAEIYERAGMKEKINPLLKEVLRNGQSNPAFSPIVQKSYMVLGLASFQEGKYDEALAYLKNVNTTTPAHIDAKFIMAQCYSRQDKFQEALQAVRSIPREKNYEPRLIVFESQMLLKLNKKKEAWAIMEKAYKANPDNADIVYWAGNTAREAGHKDKAEQIFEFGVAHFPREPAFSNALGYLYLEENKNLDDARWFIENALKIRPNDPVFVDSLGWYYFKIKNYPTALEHLQKAVQNSTDPEIWLHVIEVCGVMNKKEQARKYIEGFKEKKFDKKSKTKLEKLILKYRL